jgi:hypothetical protein
MIGARLALLNSRQNYDNQLIGVLCKRCSGPPKILLICRES